jgi:hypothetical protein
MNHDERRRAIGFGRPWWSWKRLVEDDPARPSGRAIKVVVSPWGHQVREAGHELRLDRYGRGVRYGLPAVPRSRAGKGIVGYRTFGDD